MPRLQQSQELLHHQLAVIINQEVHLEGVLLTVGYLDLSADLKQAKIGVSVLPDKYYGQALEALRRAGGVIRSRLAKSLKWRLVPRLVWEIDQREKNAAELEKIFKKIEE